MAWQAVLDESWLKDETFLDVLDARARGALGSPGSPRNVRQMRDEILELAERAIAERVQERWHPVSCTVAILSELLFCAGSQGVWRRDKTSATRDDLRQIENRLRTFRNVVLHPASTARGRYPQTVLEQLVDNLRDEGELAAELAGRPSAAGEERSATIALRALSAAGRILKEDSAELDKLLPAPSP